jgi:hypothetical protein
MSDMEKNNEEEKIEKEESGKKVKRVKTPKQQLVFEKMLLKRKEACADRKKQKSIDINRDMISEIIRDEINKSNQIKKEKEKSEPIIIEKVPITKVEKVDSPPISPPNSPQIQVKSITKTIGSYIQKAPSYFYL